MRVVLLRHGIAMDRFDPDCPADYDRALTPKGIRRTRAAVNGMRTLDVAPDRIITSPLVRAAETAEIAAQVLECSDLQVSETLSGGMHTRDVFDMLADSESTVETVICVGHAPQLDILLAQSLRAEDVGLPRLKKAGAACVEFESVEPGTGRLIWFMAPKALRALAGS